MQDIPTARVYDAVKASIRHWRRMIIWVVTTRQLSDECSYHAMVDAIGEGFSGAHCTLCKTCGRQSHGCTACPLKPICPDPESPWRAIVHATNWRTWLAAAVRVLEDLQKAKEATYLLLQVEAGKHMKKQRRSTDNA